MHAHLRTASIAALSIVASVLPVSGFPQADSLVQPTLVRSSSVVVRPYVEERSPSHEIAPLPKNMFVAEVYRPVVEAMLLRSATFRRQCERIGRTPKLIVTIASEPPVSSERPSAMTHFARYEYGQVRATVRVAISVRVPELIAHELEHVLEQLDGVDLAAKARLPASGVRACNCGGVAAFETRRAVATGLRVAREAARD